DFTDKRMIAAFQKGLDDTAASLPVKVPVVVNGDRRFGTEFVKHHCPSRTDMLVSELAIPGREDAEEAVKIAAGAWPGWRDRPLEERIAFLERLAGLLDGDRARIAGLQTYEVGKPIREADGDVAEAVDFCRYYARRALIELSPETQKGVPGEENIFHYRGRGVTLVIGPWNFPAAILCGMATAALIAGNTVILKPSGKSSAVGFALYEKMMEAGFPPDVVHFIPGAGEFLGGYLVTHPLVAQIAFTGSRDVGLSIVEKAGKTVPGQPRVKRVVCEMGGKNAIIVDDDAELDSAVSGVVKSAFGYAGQKCSACSRVIVVGKPVYESFVKRLVEACRSILMAPAHETGCRLGPVVDETAYARLLKVIDNPGEGATPLYVGDVKEAPSGGWYVPPAVFAVNDVNHPLMQKELFGPVIAVLRVDTFDEAIEAAVSTEYMLTGGVYSRSPANIEKAKKSFQVGNLYLNRHITGALVHRQPFGGFGMSGLGTKAGGPGYLLNFAEPRSVCENTMRRGYAPGLE
ncbi:MAG: aldehyde dehydrogenase family protein, partial [Nitrospinota bacterium]